MGALRLYIRKFQTDRINKRLTNICQNDKTFGIELHNILAKMCDPYVPMMDGDLSQTIEVTPEYVRYKMPYAHYQYTGIVYGPNIPITEDGVIVGWFSPPGQPKFPTGYPIQYNTQMHPLATKEWDKAMMRDNKDEFLAEVQAALRRRYNDLYG